MRSIKAACFNAVNYCKFPEGIDNIKDFAAFLNRNYHSLVELEMLSEKGCVAPYFIDGKTETEYWNTSLMRCVKESECFICTESEYNEKLKEVVANKCVHCVNYSEKECKEDYQSFREHINLDGECFGFEKKNESQASEC